MNSDDSVTQKVAGHFGVFDNWRGPDLEGVQGTDF